MIKDYQTKNKRLARTNLFKDIVIFIAYVILGYLFLDFLGAVMWIVSGQIPVTSGYIGSIFINLIN